MSRRLPPCSVPGGQWRYDGGLFRTWSLYVNGASVSTLQAVSLWDRWPSSWCAFVFRDGDIVDGVDAKTRRKAMAEVERACLRNLRMHGLLMKAVVA